MLRIPLTKKLGLPERHRLRTTTALRNERMSATIIGPNSSRSTSACSRPKANFVLYDKRILFDFDHIDDLRED